MFEHKFGALPVAVAALLMLSACTVVTSTGPRVNTTPATTGTATYPSGEQVAYTPQQLRDAYGVTPLFGAGDTGKGQTVVVIESYGSPTLQQDVNTFDQRFGLPALTPQVIAPLGTVPFDPTNSEMQGWQDETSIDVEIIHALAPGANIVVLTSPVDETEGTAGLPQFLQLEQYAVAHHLGNIVSQSFGASEYTLRDTAGRQQVAQWDQFYRQATTQDGMTFFASSGDEGATDLANANLVQRPLVPARTSSFPNDDPWVTSVGGTTLYPSGNGYTETAWGGSGSQGSGGGFSAFYAEPNYQKLLPQSVQQLAQGRRGLPDVSAAANPATGLEVYDSSSQWFVAGGTSASAPVWAAITAIGDQMAGHALGFINPALYKLATGSSYHRDFRDVTSGDNNIQNGSLFVQGYNATSGWDPVTGLGTPDAQYLLPALIATGA